MYVPPLGSCELGGFNELITSRFGRHLKNQMLGFPAKILPMMGFLSCDNSDIFQCLKLVSIGGICIEPFSCLQQSGGGWGQRQLGVGGEGGGGSYHDKTHSKEGKAPT